MDKYSLPVCTEAFSASFEKPVSFEDILPEYCPGIRKILKADAYVKAADTNFSGGVISVSAPCEIRVLYFADNGALKSVSFSHNLDFAADSSKMTDNRGEPSFFAKICIPRVYAKNKSIRSIETKLDALVSISACTSEVVKLFESDLSGDTETKRTTSIMTKRIISESRDGEISDTITLDNSLPDASEIIDYSVCISDFSSECRNEMLVYTGNAVFKCTYKTVLTKEDGENEYIYLKKTIPFEGNIAHEGISENGRCVLDITPCETDISLSADPYGENRIIGISVNYCTHAEIFCDKEVEFTYDGFCSSYECEFENTEYCFDTFSDMISRSCNLSEIIPLNGISLTEITDTELKLGSYSTELHDGKVFVSAKAYAVIMGSDANGEPCCIDHRFTIKECVDDTEHSSDRKYIICCNASAQEATLKDGELTLGYTLKADGVILERNTVKAISDANVFYDKPKPVCRSEYIIYYPDKKETLWDIAKKYEIPQKKLAEANGIDESQTLNRKTVLIPCVL